ncbi:hypothetical protein SAMN05192588_1816 [Nonlabens sp. Hel1_33_55]|uniref:hypothetical protein n=1 Tax=Nonlabens sp. Hel1_33_55 TaxID=1336802 RepID=UPI000875BE69|nr:hypothetical protein [Nonlabens sp. Hel1_33_55]SCY23821.1 hypothetical protein SAMN05192588_1816 [Nonlabens sp. Hel1_33_55]
MNRISLILLILFSSWAFAQEKILVDLEEADQLSLEVTELMFEEEFDEAFNLLALYFPFNKGDLQNLAGKFKLEIDQLQKSYGTMLSVEKGAVYDVSNIRRRIIYYLRYDYFALRLNFEFHNSKKGWVLIGFKYSDQLEDDFIKVDN